jgi:hypothetical protein
MTAKLQDHLRILGLDRSEPKAKPKKPRSAASNRQTPNYYLRPGKYSKLRAEPVVTCPSLASCHHLTDLDRRRMAHQRALQASAADGRPFIDAQRATLEPQDELLAS